MFFLFVSNDPLRRSISYVISEQKVKIDILIDIFKTFHTWRLFSRNRRHYKRILVINKQKKKIKEKIKRE